VLGPSEIDELQVLTIERHTWLGRSAGRFDHLDEYSDPKGDVYDHCDRTLRVTGPHGHDHVDPEVAGPLTQDRRLDIWNWILMVRFHFDGRAVRA
jgi:hypothetical protein